MSEETMNEGIVNEEPVNEEIVNEEPVSEEPVNEESMSEEPASEENEKKGLPKRTLIMLIAAGGLILVLLAIGLISRAVRKPDEPETPPTTVGEEASVPAQQGNGMDQAIALQREGRYTEAIAVFDDVLRENAEIGKAYLYRGVCWYNLGTYDKAIADLTQARRRASGKDLLNALSYRGAAYVNSRQYPEAEGDLTHAIELDPAYTEAYRFRAQAYEGMGKMDLAAQDRAMAGETVPAAAENTAPENPEAAAVENPESTENTDNVTDQP